MKPASSFPLQRNIGHKVKKNYPGIFLLGAGSCTSEKKNQRLFCRIKTDDLELNIFNQIPPEQQVNNTTRGPVWRSFKAESIVSIAIQVVVFNKEINISW